MKRKVIGSKTHIAYKDDPNGGLLVHADDLGEGWFYTHMTWQEVEAMHKNLEPAKSSRQTV